MYNGSISSSLINLISEDDRMEDREVTLQELETNQSLFDESLVSFDNEIDGMELRSKEDIDHKLRSLNDILAMMKITASKSTTLANQLDDADVYNATSNVLKRTFDSHVSYIKTVDTLNNTKTELEVTDGEGQSSYITLDNIDSIIDFKVTDEENDDDDEEE